MIYFVTGQQELFSYIDSPIIKYITVEESLELLKPLRRVGLDTETRGTEVFQGVLSLVQFGNKHFQVVIDAETIDIKRYKEFLESKRTFIIHNAKFDLRWFYKEGIVIKKVFDTFLAEKILYLGFPPGRISLSLQACTMRYKGVHLDKTVRGEIHKGITERVIMYAANDVVHLEDIMLKQINELAIRGELEALRIENEFVRVLAYIEFSGIKLDVTKWQYKMSLDNDRLAKAEKELNDWVINYVLSKESKESIYIDYRKSKKQKIKRGVNQYVVIDPQLDLFSAEPNKPRCIINWNSSKQVIPLFEELGFNLWTKDKKTGKPKKSVESKIIATQMDVSDIAPYYLEYSAAFKVVTSFGQNFLDAINPKTGRLHPNFNQMMDTGRLSCGKGGKKGGGKTKDDDAAEEESNSDEVIDTSDKSVNIQQIPNDELTRSCFVSEKGFKLVDADYSDQEGHVFTELTRDQAWIDFYNDPAKRDGHSFVAKMIFADELEGIEEKDVGKVRPDLRQDAKPARFTFNYNGGPPALSANTGKSIEFCMMVFDMYFKAFPGIKDYFRKQKQDWWDRGYILINEQTGLRAWIYDWPVLRGIKKRIDYMDNYWDIRRQSLASGKVIDDIPTSVLQQIYKKFADGVDIKNIAIRYEYKRKTSKKDSTGKPIYITDYIDINRETVYVVVSKYYHKRRASSDNQSCNYTSQGTAAAMTKEAAINYFSHLEDENLVFKVWIPNDVHDELMVEAPDEIAEVEAKHLKAAMETAADKYCSVVTIKTDPQIGDHWLH